MTLESIINRLTACTMVLFLAVGMFAPVTIQAQDQAQDEAELPQPVWEWDETDPRIGLASGLHDAGEAAWNIQLLANLPKPEAFTSEDAIGAGSVNNTDLAFTGNMVVVGNYYGFNFYDVSDPHSPRLRLSVVCPGGQGDLSVYGNLLFMSAQEGRGRLDCGTQGVEEQVSDERIKGVRIFDFSDLDNIHQVAAVQTCRGSHTHTLVKDPNDDDNIYVYVQGTSGVRPEEELPGCVGGDPEENPETAYFRIEVIQVPLDAPQDARIVNMPRIFADESGNIAGLWQGGDHGPGTQRSRTTNQCHDITAYPALGLAGGACSGNGILLDISDPANPVRIEEVEDPNFAYWHSATFNNDGTTVLFTDEWGGGGAPRCLPTDLPTWGANAMFKYKDGELTLAGYYKLPAPQTENENCVAHNGSLIPVPGRDIKVQAWYQGGLSMFDFTDPANAHEIAFFDRGPVADSLLTGGYWSTYWYNGYIYGSEIARGFDVLELQPSEHLSQNEIDAAKLVVMDEFNPQMQPHFTWPTSFVVARAYVDQLQRAGAVTPSQASQLRSRIDAAEADNAMAASLDALESSADMLERDALSSLVEGNTGNENRVRALLASELRDLADMKRGTN